MDKINKQPIFHYASSHDDPRDLFIDVELSDDLYFDEEEKIIDNLMEDFYKNFMDEFIKRVRKKVPIRRKYPPRKRRE